MALCKIILVYPNGEEVEEDDLYDDEVWDVEAQAQYLCSCSETGAEVLSYSNPGDYPYDANTFEGPTYRIERVEG